MSVKETEGVLVMEDRVDVGPSVVHKNKICKKQNKDRQREDSAQVCGRARVCVPACVNFCTLTCEPVCLGPGGISCTC